MNTFKSIQIFKLKKWYDVIIDHIWKQYIEYTIFHVSTLSSFLSQINNNNIITYLM